ncbi:RadC family protein [Pseudomonas fluorescens]|uniref:RadC family protein n=1 Tax=Pseudomonas fluorescens TaxID=294 RepID=A0A379I7H3_PSEFL|nr:RadC family protein [Pseudomonas fluorescens]
MRLHKLKASESTGTYQIESPISEADILLMARQLANLTALHSSSSVAVRDSALPPPPATRHRYQLERHLPMFIL